jgi:hypothetical protein
MELVSEKKTEKLQKSMADVTIGYYVLDPAAKSYPPPP